MASAGGLWIALAGIASTAVWVALHAAGRRQANARLLRDGARVEGEVLSCDPDGDRCTVVRVRFTPAGGSAPLEIRCRLDGRVRLTVGARVDVRHWPKTPKVAVLEAWASRQDASSNV